MHIQGFQLGLLCQERCLDLAREKEYCARVYEECVRVYEACVRVQRQKEGVRVCDESKSIGRFRHACVWVRVCACARESMYSGVFD